MALVDPAAKRRRTCGEEEYGYKEQRVQCFFFQKGKPHEMLNPYDGHDLLARFLPSLS